MPDVPAEYQVQIPIEVAETAAEDGTTIPSYRDTLFITASEFQTMTWDEVQALKDARYNTWLSNFLTPPPAPEPMTEEDALQQAQAALLQAQQAIAQSIDAVNAVQGAGGG